MTTIRRACLNDVFKTPYLGLTMEGEIIPHPEPGRNKLYNLVAKAPGNHIMAYVCASALESGIAKRKTIAIDECGCNILYKSMAPLETLVCRLEEILGYEKNVSSIQVDVRGSRTCRAGKMFAKLGYIKNVLHDQNIFRWTKPTASTSAIASQASTSQASTSQVSTSQASTAAVASQASTSQASTVAVSSQTSTSQASTVAVASQAPTAAVASQAPTAAVASQASTAADVTMEDISAAFAARMAFDCGGAPCDPSYLAPQAVRHMSMSGHINSACNSEFDLEDSGSDG